MPVEEPSGPTRRAAIVVTWPQPLPATARYHYHRAFPSQPLRRDDQRGRECLCSQRTDVEEIVTELQGNPLERHRLERRGGDVEVEGVDAEGAVRVRHLRGHGYGRGQRGQSGQRDGDGIRRIKWV